VNYHWTVGKSGAFNEIMQVTFEKSLVIGASGGIGAALVEALGRQGVTALSRRGDGFDITDEASVERHARAAGRDYDLIIDATGALEIDGAGPEKSFAAIDPELMARQMAVNAIGPALIFKHFMPLLVRDRPAVIASLSARVGSIGDNRLGGWVSYRSAKAALNQIVRCAAIELSRTHKQSICVALHPGTVQTPLTAKYVGNHPSVPPQEAANNLLRVISELTPEDTGGFYDWQGKDIVW
jgi:NAD(P)-dependent dehydrogenase (short-subunit alcohol dehydrogenase family)